MEKGFFRFKNFQLHFTKTGEGKSVWITFHGFGQTHAVFDHLHTSIKGNSTIYNFDLPFHGGSHYDSERPFSNEDWLEAFYKFIDEHRIINFSLAGFSIGCRLMFPILTATPHRIDKILLLAPDGITDNLVYRISTLPIIRRLLRWMVFKPSLFYKIAYFSIKYSLLQPSVVKFAISQMKTREQRWRVYKTWVLFRKLKTDYRHVVKALKSNNIPVILVLASKDHLIKKKAIQKFIDELDNCTLVQIDSGHYNLVEKSEEVFKLYL